MSELIKATRESIVPFKIVPFDNNTLEGSYWSQVVFLSVENFFC